MQRDAYLEFLRSKVASAPITGFEISDEEINPVLKPFQRAIVRWAVRGGQRGIFARFGLGKTMMQLEALRLTLEKAGGGRALVVAPLGVRQEFTHDVYVLNTGDSPDVSDQQRRELILWRRGQPDSAIDLRFIRSVDDAGETGIYLTNYETVREGKLDPRLFTAASLDEASCLRGFGGTKTFREFMRLFAGDGKTLHERIRSSGVRYRFVATATPSPNEYIELLAYSAFLGVMDVGQAKTRFFQRDSEKADALTLLPHKEEEFWLWVASWELFVQRPSDLGFSDEGYDLPPLEVRWHEIPTDHVTAAGSERDGQAKMFADSTVSVQNAAKIKRDSLSARIEKLLQIRAEDPHAHRVLWHDLEAEREAIERVIPHLAYGRWLEVRDGHPIALELYERHYSARKYADGRERKLLIGPGEKTVLITAEGDALFGWRRFQDDSGQEGVNCAVFRNEGKHLSSELIQEAMAIAWKRWPGERLYTYVDADEVESSNPGYCFIAAGWTRCGRTKDKDLVILEVLPGAAVPEVAAQPVFRSVYGAQDLEVREQAIIDFSAGRIRELAGKPVMLGSGCNFQRHCAWAIYLGIGFKFNDFIQSVHRLYRFLQKRSVRIDLIYSEAERGVRRRLEEKWRRHDEQIERMTEIIRKYGLSEAAMATSLQRSLGTERAEIAGPGFHLVNDDCVLETFRMASDSVHLILTSIPFSTQYEYTPSYHDFGHSDNNAQFWTQMDFLLPELLRVLRPGRVAAVHVKDRIVPGGMTGLGFQTVYPFHADAIARFTAHGFAFLGMKTIVTDVVRENNQTYRLGWTEQCKDGSRMGCGMSEYLLLFRKPPTDRSNGYADDPVVKEKREWGPDGWENPDGYSRARWQLDAHGFMRSSGNRLLMPEELLSMPADQVYRLFKLHSESGIYDYEHHVRICETLDAHGQLPKKFMLLPPASWHPDVWADVARMRTLNMVQSAKGQEQHLCPLQFDIVDRVVRQFSAEGEEIYDPFGGIFTVPYRALQLRRRARAVELNPQYFADGCGYVRAAAEQMAMPSLFDAIEEEEEVAA